MTQTSAMPLLNAERISKSFGTHQVLKSIDLTVEAGDVTCIVGPSGSGKSTLLRCLNYLEVPTSGVVYLEGEPVGMRWKGDRLYRMSFNELAVQRQRMGMVFQGFHLFPTRRHWKTSPRRRSSSRACGKPMRLNGPWRCCTRSGSATTPITTPGSFQAVSSSASQLPVRWPCSRR